MTEMKVCTKCGQRKAATLEFFYENKRLKSGLSSRCRACTAAKQKQWRLGNPEKAKEVQRRYAESHREVLAERSRENYRRIMADPELASRERERCRQKSGRERASNPERVNARMRIWRERHPEYLEISSRRRRERYHADNDYRAKIVQSRRTYRRCHPDRVRLWNQRWVESNRDRHRLNQRIAMQRRRASGSITTDQWLAIVKSQDNKCAYCKKPLVDVGDCTLDHVIPVSRGGRTEVNNVVAACRSCNSSKYNKLISEWQPGLGSPAQKRRS